jgi:hypothetical protein
VFSTIPALAGRVIDALKASGASPEVVKDAMAIRRRFNSPARRLVTPAQNGLPDGNAQQGETIYQRKLSQLDLASKVENFERLVNRVSVEPLYKPNETDLQPVVLTTFVTTLRTSNANVIGTFMAMKNANRALNALLFQATGIHGTAIATKAYLRSVFGKGSSEYREVGQFKFIKK